MNNSHIINPLELTKESRQLLSELFDEYGVSGCLLRKNKTYWIGLRRIRLTHDILVRKKSFANWHYDVIDEQSCGAGKFGSAYKILAVLKRGGKHNAGELLFKLKDKRVYKYQKNAAQYEFDLMTRCPHLHARALYSGLPSLISMRKLPGSLLIDALNDDRKEQRFTHAQRYRITIGLLRALKKQIHDNMICHRDIKPDNIFYDPETGEINIFDLGISKLIGVNVDRRSRGNATFSPPEEFTSVRTQRPVTAGEFRSFLAMESKATVKSDIFSMARVIGLVWGDSDPIFYIKNADHMKLMLRRIVEEWQPRLNLFRDINNVSADEKQKIESQLRKMTAFSPADRPDLSACITYFDAMYLDYKLAKAPPQLHAVMREAHRLALSAQSTLDDMEKQYDLYARLKVATQEFKCNAAMPIDDVIRFFRKKLTHRYKMLGIELEQMRDQFNIDGKDALQDFLTNTASQTTVANMHLYLQSTISSLDDNQVAVTEFIETLDFKCLAGISSKHELHQRIDSIFNTFMDNVQKIFQLYEHAEHVSDLFVMDDLKHLLTQLYYDRLNLDAIKETSDHLARKIQKLENDAQPALRHCH